MPRPPQANIHPTNVATPEGQHPSKKCRDSRCPTTSQKLWQPSRPNIHSAYVATPEADHPPKELSRSPGTNERTYKAPHPSSNFVRPEATHPSKVGATPRDQHPSQNCREPRGKTINQKLKNSGSYSDHSSDCPDIYTTTCYGFRNPTSERHSARPRRANIRPKFVAAPATQHPSKICRASQPPSPLPLPPQRTSLQKPTKSTIPLNLHEGFNNFLAVGDRETTLA